LNVVAVCAGFSIENRTCPVVSGLVYVHGVCDDARPCCV